MKAAALFILALGPALFGFWWGEKKRERRKALSSFRRFLEETDREIRLFLRPAPEIFREFKDPFLEKKGFLPLLREECEKSAPGALERTANRILPELIRDKRTMEIIRSYCGRFGTLPKDLQLKENETALEYVTVKEKEWTARENADIRLARTLGCAVGVGLLILFV